MDRRIILPDYFSGKAIEVHVYGAQDGRENKMDHTSIFKTPESIISQYGGTAISEDGNVMFFFLKMQLLLIFQLQLLDKMYLLILALF